MISEIKMCFNATSYDKNRYCFLNYNICAGKQYPLTMPSTVNNRKRHSNWLKHKEIIVLHNRGKEGGQTSGLFRSSSSSVSPFPRPAVWAYSQAGRKMILLVGTTHPHTITTQGRKSISSCSSSSRVRKLYPEALRNSSSISGAWKRTHDFTTTNLCHQGKAYFLLKSGFLNQKREGFLSVLFCYLSSTVNVAWRQANPVGGEKETQAILVPSSKFPLSSNLLGFFTLHRHQMDIVCSFAVWIMPLPPNSYAEGLTSSTSEWDLIQKEGLCGCT